MTEHELEEVDHQFREKHLPYTFLIDQTCVIYPVRPLVCRRHIAESKPGLCRTDSHRVTTPEAMHGFRQAIRMFFNPTVSAVFARPLAFVVTDALKL